MAGPGFTVYGGRDSSPPLKEEAHPEFRDSRGPQRVGNTCGLEEQSNQRGVQAFPSCVRRVASTVFYLQQVHVLFGQYSKR